MTNNTEYTIRTDVELLAQDVHKSFGETQALRGANLQVAKGEIVAIMGPSGSGKSTLLHSLAGITDIDSGQIIVDGQDISGLNDKERTLLRRSKYGFVFQFSELVPELTALDNVALPLLLSKVNRKTAYEKAGEWLKVVGLENRADSLAGTLSGGEAQRIAIARAMITAPKVLFGDEPTGSLDSTNSRAVMQLFVETARANGTTVVIVTHEPEIATYADRTVTVQDGIIL
jgi:putative ABC transport system ATP-binding protein